MPNAFDLARDAASTADEVVRDVKKFAVNIGRLGGKSSLARLTKDQIFQFPVIMDAGVEEDERYPIIKAIEKNYAQLVMAAISNDGRIDRTRYHDVNDWLKKFHNNFTVPLSMESVFVTNAITTEGTMFSSNELKSMWDNVEDCLDKGMINNMYTPYKFTEAKLSRAIEAAYEQRERMALEGLNDLYFRRYFYKRNKKGEIEKTSSGYPILETEPNGEPKFEYFRADSKDPKYQWQVQKWGEPKTMAEWTRVNKEKTDKEEQPKQKLLDRQTVGTTKGQVLNDTKYSNLSPTIINFTLANTEKGVGTWTQNLTIGVKAMPRFISQNLMVSNMVEGAKNKLIFQFIKWTKNEIKFSDIFFGITAARDYARGQNHMMKVLAKRAKSARASKLNPNTTIIITDATCHIVYEKCGVNLQDPIEARKLMDKYFLLSFGVYDTEAKMLKIIYDGEEDFAMHSLRSMIAEGKEKLNLLNPSRF